MIQQCFRYHKVRVKKVLVWFPLWQVFKKKQHFFLKQPRREKGMNNDCTCLPLSAMEPATCLFFISIAQFPPFPLSLPPFGQYLWNQTSFCACQKITTSAAATGCQGSSPPDNLRAHWGNQKLSKVKCPLLWLSLCGPVQHRELWLRCRCTNGLFVIRDH